MSHALEALRLMPIEELIEEHDRRAVNTSVGVSYYLEEIARRDLMAFAESVVASTREVAASGRRMEIVTWIIAALTLANLLLVAVVAT